MLAAFSFATYSTAEHALQSGDRLLLYTDGLLEAANAQGEEFGPTASTTLKAIRASRHRRSRRHIVSTLNNGLQAQNDDLTLLLCDYTAV